MNQVLNADACFNATDPQQYFEKLYYIFLTLNTDSRSHVKQSAKKVSFTACHSGKL